MGGGEGGEAATAAAAGGRGGGVAGRGAARQAAPPDRRLDAGVAPFTLGGAVGAAGGGSVGAEVRGGRGRGGSCSRGHSQGRGRGGAHRGVAVQTVASEGQATEARGASAGNAPATAAATAEREPQGSRVADAPGGEAGPAAALSRDEVPRRRAAEVGTSGQNQQKARGARSGPQKQRAKRGGQADREGGSGESADEPPNGRGSHAPEGKGGAAERVKGKGAMRKAVAPRGRGRPQWWRKIEDTDPITLELLNRLQVPPFGLKSEDGSHTYLFDGRVLAMYLVSSGQFLNPLTNIQLSRADCERLDGHLHEHRLGQPCVSTVFDEVQKKGEESLQVRSFREEASLIMAAIFSQGVSHGTPSRQSLREVRRGAGRPAARQPPLEARQMGAEGLVLYDDDWGMVPEAPQRPEEAFPALSSGDSVLESPTHSWSFPGQGGALGFRGPPPGGAPGEARGPPADRSDPQPTGEGEPLRQWGRVAANLKSNAAEWVVRPTAGRVRQELSATAQRPPTKEEEARQRRRLQLAEAFGVSNPDRPAEFLLQSAAQSYTPESLGFARKFPGRTQSIEAALENFIHSGRSRMSLLSASKAERKVTHELAQLYGIVTSSFGSGSGRQVDLFRPSSCTLTGAPSSSAALPRPQPLTLCRPPVLLSEAAVLPDEALEAAAGPPVGGAYPEELLLYDVTGVSEGSLSRFFHGLDVVQVEVRLGENPAVYALKFSTKEDLVSARERAAGGIRGAFRVLGASEPQDEPLGAPLSRHGGNLARLREGRLARPAAPEAAEPPVDPDILEALLEMGFSWNRCVRALHGQTSGSDVDEAIAWLLANEGNPKLDEPLLLPKRAFRGRSALRIFQPTDTVAVGNSWEALAGRE